MSFFTGTTKLSNTSTIPSGDKITKDAAVTLLHDHDFFLSCDPHYVSHRALPGDADDAGRPASEVYQLPAGLEAVGSPAVRLYEVVDHVPNPVWSSSVVSREKFVDLREGLWVRIRSPLAIVMETQWTIREADDGALELVEDVEISCSKLLLGIVRGQVDANWKGIHAKIVARLVGDARGKAEE
ncbi:hypothetical protein F4804DRAFT_300100 [Jackrogersella minutella]|nr:hypothetical protein F4804DRAFT_300100 [Jackrogersella minutella]